ncbi:ATP-binding protein [Pseudonocardia nigra]|uniref:ATP-binding protein n=1 Tax=Pseudonocardia nigra TaxID=1921578 RepID=UPI001C605D2E|nr:AAA family ATPase [Pseudonocardia nigra]
MLTRSPLVGRTLERAGLEAALADCRRGCGGLVLVSGDAGVGKSRLVAETLADWAGCVLRGAASAGAGAYAPVAEVLRAVSDQFGDAALADHARALLPELATAGSSVDRPALVAAVRRTLRDIARQQPAVVVLEDLHWASAATAELVPVLASSLADEPVLLLATYRSEELPRAHPVRRMRTELRRNGGFHEFALAPLTAEETGALLAGLVDGTPSAGFVAAVHDRAAGLPFFVEELVAALVEAGALRERDGTLDLDDAAVLPLPDSVLDAVLVRTAALRRRHGSAVELAAVLGVRVDLPVLADLVPPSDVDELLDAGLLSERTACSAVFRHALVRDALYRTVPWARRRGHHRLVAEHLTARGAPPEVIAEHWLAAREPERARPLLLAAAERCCAVHAYRDAAVLAQRALAIWPDDAEPDERTTVLECLADCAELGGELESAVETWTTVARIRRSGGDMERAGRAQRRLANAAELLGDLPEAVTAREAAAEAFAAAGLRGDAAAERLTLAEQLKAAAHLSKALEQAVAATDDAAAAGRTDVQAHALALQAPFAPRSETGAVGWNSPGPDSSSPWHGSSPKSPGRPTTSWAKPWSTRPTTRRRPTRTARPSSCAVRTVSPSWRRRVSCARLRWCD